MKKKEQIIEFPNAPFKAWCDGKVVVIKDMEENPLFSRRLEYGRVRLVALKRVTHLQKAKEIKHTTKFGKLKIRFEWRSKDNFWGRFGGGWNWKLGIQVGGHTVILSLVTFSLSFSWIGKPKKEGNNV